MKNKYSFLKIAFLLCGLTFSRTAYSQDRPNILWLVTEDMSPYLSCYGNKMIKTPNLDKLAAEGVRYTKAFSNGTQCSPSRSTLISGRYAISLGTDIHRHEVNVNDSLYFPIYLRRAGYYCANNPKEDYNNNKTPHAVWDQSGRDADYNNRPDKSKPFFAMYNNFITHMSRVAKNINKRTPDAKRTVHLKDVIVPPYIPDLPEVRDDISWNMDAVLIMDRWVGAKIQELKDRGEYDNTIIIFSSDHGGTVPRGKAYVYESGTLIPLIIHFPPKWKHLATTPVPAVTDRMVSFVDFGPTILSLADVKVPSYMIGKPFLTPAGAEKKNVNQYILTFRANQSSSFAPSRSIQDHHFHLIWNFQSAYPNGTRQGYQWEMPAQQAWDKAWLAGTLKSDLYKSFWLPAPTYELYDVQTDSLETRNLVNDKRYTAEFKRLKTELEHQLHQQQDLGLIPPQYKFALQKHQDIVSVVREKGINIDEVIDAAALASQKNKANTLTLVNYLKNKNPMVQYWGASGLCGLTKTGAISTIPDEAKKILNQQTLIEEAQNMLAEAMVYTTNSNDAQTGLNYLLASVKNGSSQGAACIQNLGKKAMPITNQLQGLLNAKSGDTKFYIRSALITCGVLPYDALYKLAPGESIGD